jgi:hypothetical protein
MERNPGKRVVPPGVSDDVFAPSMHAKDAIKADEVPKRLRVTIIQANGLKHLNSMTGDNLYCQAVVKHADKRIKSKAVQTKIVKKSLDPYWNETFEMEPWQAGEPLEFTIYDQGLLGSRTEGKALLPSEYFHPEYFEGEVPIEGLEHAMLRVAVTVEGHSLMSGAGRYAQCNSNVTPPISGHPSSQAIRHASVARASPRKLEVSIMWASGLEHLNLTGDAPFCTCTVVRTGQGTTTKTFQTKALKGTLEPAWNETH